jgi:hypothetical protein
MMNRKHIFCCFLKGIIPILEATYSQKMFFLLRVIVAKQILIAVFFCMGSVAAGTVSTRVCRADGNTPLELADPCIPFVYRDVMVGTKLTIIVSSDVNAPWENGGCLSIEGQYLGYGILSALGPEVGADWTGSHLPAAGNEAAVYYLQESGVDEFDLYTDPAYVEAGDWFIIDYDSNSIGDCNVGFYDFNISWDVPVHYLSFSHVRTRDFNNDTKVDFADFAIFASHWRATDCNDPNWCQGTDLDVDGSVDVNDLMLFCEYWLERTQ